MINEPVEAKAAPTPFLFATSKTPAPALPNRVPFSHQPPVILFNNGLIGRI